MESNGKLTRWLSRSRDALQETTAKESVLTQGSAPCRSGKLSRWLDRAQQRGSEQGTETSKLNRWICRSKSSNSGPVPQPAKGPAHDWSDVPSHVRSFQEEVEILTQRIRNSWAVVDAALALRSNSQQAVECEESEETEDGSDSQVQTTAGLRCPSCGVELSGESMPACNEAMGNDNSGFRGLGLRVEEARKGLAVTHVVPDGLADNAGFLVRGNLCRCAALSLSFATCLPARCEGLRLRALPTFLS